MKRVAASFFLLLVLFNTVGIYGVYVIGMERAMVQMAGQIDIDAPLVLRIGQGERKPEKGLFARLGNSELLFRGHYYDIASEKMDGTTLVVYGHRDDFETGVQNMFRSQQAQADENSGEEKRVNLKISEDFLVDETVTGAIDDQCTIPVLFLTSRYNTLSPVTPVAAPPPKRNSKNVHDNLHSCQHMNPNGYVLFPVI